MKCPRSSFGSRACAACACALLAVAAPAQNNNDWFIRQQQMQQMQRQQEAMRRQQDEIRRQQAAEQQRRMEEERRRLQDQQRREQQRMLEEQRRRQLDEQRRQQDAQRQRIQQEQAAQRQRDLARAQRDRGGAPRGTFQQNPNRDMARGTGVAPGSNRTILANGRLARPLTPGEIQRGFTGRVTADGRALIKVQNRVFTVPASRIAGLSARLARLKASTSLSTRHQAGMRDLAQQLATSGKPPSVASRLDAARAARAGNQLRLDKVKLVDNDALAAKQAALKSRPVSGSSEKLRKQPGVATYNGKLSHVTNPQWLAGRNSVAVPAQIAQRLNGRSFRTFSQFRAAFWKEVAADPVLRQSFDDESLASMRDGKAPSVASDQQRGKRAVYELDHHHEIQDGGGTYDLNNIRIKTPNAHIRKISRDFNLSSGAH